MCDGLDGFGSHDGLHHVLVVFEETELTVAAHDVVEENHHYLVAVDELVFTVVVADYAAYAVGVGVGGNNEVGINFLSLCNCHGHGRRILGVGGIHGGEVARRDVLFGNMDDVGEAVIAQRVGHEFHACAVDRCVDNLEVGVTLDYLGVEREALDGF